MKIIRPILVLVTLSVCVARSAATDLSKTVCIKADDFRGLNRAWLDFLRVSRDAGVKISIGVIAESIHADSTDISWMREQEKAGDVEFWDHGWDHGQWNSRGQDVTEFDGSGLAHQALHLGRAQTALGLYLGHDVAVLGTPFNGLDADTARAVIEAPEIRLLFTYVGNSKTASARALLPSRVFLLDIINEADGTGKPNAVKLAKRLADHSSEPVALQFHPPNMDAQYLEEYRKILSYLKVNGYTVVLPRAYLGAKR